MTDAEAQQLLELLYKYVTEYGNCEDMPISEMADDLAMSMDVTSDRADELRQLIGEALHV